MIQFLRNYQQEQKGASAASGSSASSGGSAAAAAAAAGAAAGAAASSAGADSDAPSSVMPVLEISMEDMQKNRHFRGRRAGVSAETVSQEELTNQPYRVVPKSNADREQIRQAVKNNILFSDLDEVQMNIVVDAMEQKVFQRDEWIIKQGEEGHDFYVVQHGVCETYIQLGLEQKMVKVYNHGESFGELALMYNVPRAASIKAASESVTLWAMDRATFRRVLLRSTAEKRTKYEEFLKNVPVLQSLDQYERAKVADALVERECAQGEYIVTMGDTKDDKFYILLNGRAAATKVLDGDQSARTVMEYGPGDYFGELALLSSGPRAANVIAQTPARVVCLDRGAFERLLGPCKDILQRDQTRYAAMEQKIKTAEAAAPSPRV
jgi:cAMP-dependent protein kinase regulator